MIRRRLGLHPHANEHFTTSEKGCPDLFELEDGRFAAIGLEATELLRPHLPADAGCGRDERIVIIDRHVLVHAKRDIPDTI